MEKAKLTGSEIGDIFSTQCSSFFYGDLFSGFCLLLFFFFLGSGMGVIIHCFECRTLCLEIVMNLVFRTIARLNTKWLCSFAETPTSMTMIMCIALFVFALEVLMILST